MGENIEDPSQDNDDNEVMKGFKIETIGNEDIKPDNNDKNHNKKSSTFKIIIGSAVIVALVGFAAYRVSIFYANNYNGGNTANGDNNKHKSDNNGNTK